MHHLVEPARAVNTAWLRGWGCRVERRPQFRVLWNPDFPDYNTIYDIDSPAEVNRALGVAGAEFPEEAQPTIYLPPTPGFGRAVGVLTRAGYAAAVRTQTLVAPVEEGGAAGELELAAVESNTLDTWIRLYAANYGVPSDAGEANARRWRKGFEQGSGVEFLLVVLGGAAVGTAQLVTVEGSDLAGLYSVSLAAEQASIGRVSELQALLSGRARQAGARSVCLERLRAASRVHVADRIGMRLRWHGVEWERVSEDIGFRRG